MGMGHRLAEFAPYSWRSDRTVPAFPDEHALIVFDGVCVLCSGFARFVAARDPALQFRFTTAQSPLGQALYRHFDLDPVNYETNLLLSNGRAFAKLAAFSGVMSGLGWPWAAAGVVGRLPTAIADPLYDRIARNRYRLFGRRDVCMRPDASWSDRVIE